MDAKVFGRFIAEVRKENDMTQTDLADKLGVTDKAVSRWERGIGFPDVNTLEPLACALGLSVFELMHSKKTEMKKEATGEWTNESGMLDVMDMAVEMARENQRQQRVSQWLGIIVVIAIAILIKLFCEVSIGAALLVGGVVALVSVALYFYVRNYYDRQSRKIYGFFMLAGTLCTLILFQLSGIGANQTLGLVYGILVLSVVLTYR